jgi:hypothetical protein
MALTMVAVIVAAVCISFSLIWFQLPQHTLNSIPLTTAHSCLKKLPLSQLSGIYRRDCTSTNSWAKESRFDRFMSKNPLT